MFAGIWTENRNKVNWGVTFTDAYDKYPHIQTLNEYVTLGALKATQALAGARAALIVPLRTEPFVKPGSPKGPGHDQTKPQIKPRMRYLTIWRDDRVGVTAAHANMSKETFKASRKKYEAQGLHLIRAVLSKPGATTRVSAIWAEQERPFGRVWVAKPALAPTVGLTGASEAPLTTVSVFEPWVKKFMKHYGLRGAQLAIVRKHKLVYARAFTWAEESYRDVKPTDLFRIGSISKTLTAIATMIAISKEKGLDLKTNVAEYLDLRKLDGNKPAFNAWGKLKVDHLLRHLGGWKREPTDPNKAVDFSVKYEKLRAIYEANGKVLPLPYYPEHWVSAVASLGAAAWDDEPGTHPAYSGTGAGFLSAIVAKAGTGTDKGNAHQFGMANLLFKQLGVTRARVANGYPRYTVGVYETRPETRVLSVGRSEMSPERPLLPLRYSGNWWAAPSNGAWLLSVVDLARIVAACDRNANELMPQDMKDDMMWAEVEPDSGTRRGFIDYGFFPDAKDKSWPTVGYNGVIGGGRAIFSIRKDGFVIVFQVNGDLVEGLDHNGNLFEYDGLATNHLREINDLANTIEVWPNHDQFPDYGLPAVKPYQVFGGLGDGPSPPA